MNLIKWVDSLEITKNMQTRLAMIPVSGRNSSETTGGRGFKIIGVCTFKENPTPPTI